jgi:hypothetical protein
MSKAATAIALVLALLLAAGAMTSCFHSTAVVYPAHWPLPQLTVPPGSVRQKMMSFEGVVFGNGYLVDDLDNGPEGKYYAFAFKPSVSWDEVVRYVDGCLLSTGFEEKDAEKSAKICSSGVLYIKFYASTDSRFDVTLIYSPSDDTYEYRVNYLENPAAADEYE